MAPRRLLTVLACAAVCVACGARGPSDGGADGDDECPELVLEDDLRVQSTDLSGDLPLNVDVDTLPLYTHVTGVVSVGYAPGVRSLDFLRCLRRIDGSLHIVGNPDLEVVAGLERVESIGEDLSVRGNPHLTSLDALESLHTIDDYALVDNNREMTTLGLPALEMVANLEVGHFCAGGNSSLAAIGGLQSLQLGTVLIAGHGPSLVSLEGLSGLEDRMRGAGPRITLVRNEGLPIDHVHAVLDAAVEQGMNLTTCGNKDEEPCEPCPPFPP